MKAIVGILLLHAVWSAVSDEEYCG